MAEETKSRLWTFLNSNFGLFILGSVVVSFISWSYTQWSDALESSKITTEKILKLETEVSYRVQLLQNYFDSECTEPSELSAKTFDDIDEIYTASSNYKPIFSENAGKELHALVWELSSLQTETLKQPYVSSFDSLLQFNAYLNRLKNQTGAGNSFYGNPVDFVKEVDLLKTKFAAAIHKLDGLPIQLLARKS